MFHAIECSWPSLALPFYSATCNILSLLLFKLACYGNYTFYFSSVLLFLHFPILIKVDDKCAFQPWIYLPLLISEGITIENGAALRIMLLIYSQEKERKFQEQVQPENEKTANF